MGTVPGSAGGVWREASLGGSQGRRGQAAFGDGEARGAHGPVSQGSVFPDGLILWVGVWSEGQLPGLQNWNGTATCTQLLTPLLPGERPQRQCGTPQNTPGEGRPSAVSLVFPGGSSEAGIRGS